jgi:hypothetical protein
MIDDEIVITDVELELWENKAIPARTHAIKMKRAAHAEFGRSFIDPPSRHNCR